MFARPLGLLLLVASSVTAEPATPPAPAAAAFDSSAALAKARRLRPFVSAGNPAPLWDEFDEPMRAAMKDSTSFAAMLSGIAASTGRIDSVLVEELRPSAGHFVYTATCKFAIPPDPLLLVLTFNPDGRIGGMFVRPASAGKPKAAPSAYLDYQVKTTLHLPFNGEWDVFWGGRTIEQNYHAATRDQRFAHDVLILKDGRSHDGDGKKLTDYYCYGQPILAPAAGTVVWTRDSLPDNPPGVMDRQHATGNSIVIDHGNREFSLLAHLQPGSLRFHVGDHVPDGAIVGLCGNSGNTSEPHLHVHLQNGPLPFAADGLPEPFVDLVVDGKHVDRAEIVKGQKVRRAP